MECGVILNDIVPEGFETRDLFQTHDTAKDARRMGGLEALNAKHNGGTVFLASAGIERPWKISPALKSPAHTTNSAETPTIDVSRCQSPSNPRRRHFHPTAHELLVIAI